MNHKRLGALPFFVWPLLLLACMAVLLLLVADQPEPVDAPVPPQLYSSTYQLIGTGNRLGTYYPAGQALAEWFNSHLASDNSPGGAFKAVETNGSVDNVRLLSQKRFLLGMVESRIIKEQYELASSSLRLVWPLWNDVVHLVASPETAKSKIAFPGETRNYLGQTNSSTSRTSSEILKALGHSSSLRGFDLPPEEVMQSLIHGQIGFATIQAGMPNKTVSDALIFNGCSLFSMSEEQLEKILPRVASARRFVIPAGYYGEKQSETVTVGLPNMLVTNAEVDPALIEKIVELLTGGLTHLRMKHQALADIPVDSDAAMAMMKDAGVPVHQGTLDYISRKKQPVDGGSQR